MEFKSQICTNVIQSQRLIELGLKYETADMVHVKETAICPISHTVFALNSYKVYSMDYIKNQEFSVHVAAWSLHRLMKMMPLMVKGYELFITYPYVEYSKIDCCDRVVCLYDKCNSSNIYDNIIDTIEWLIEENHFNKKYLKEK